MATHRLLSSFVLALSLLSLSLHAAAQLAPPGREAAEERFSQARLLIKAGKIAEACEKFEESQALEPAIGTLLHLADCYEQRGSPSLAWTTFQRAAQAARAAGKIEREKKALARASALAARVSLLALDIDPAALPEVTLRLDGQPVERARWNSSFAVDPGRHLVEVEAPGHASWSVAFSLVPSSSAFHVSVPRLSPTPAVASVSAPPPAPPPPPAAVAPAASSSPPALLPAPARPADSRRALAVVAAGAGVVAVGVGAFFGWRSFSRWDALDGHCNSARQCDDIGLQRASEARSAARLSNLFFGLGALGVGAGTLLWLTAPESPASLSISSSPGGLSLDLRRAF